MRKLLNLSFPLFILSLFLFRLLFLDFRDTSEEYRHEGKSNRECGRYIGDHALNRRLKHLLCNGNGRQIHNTTPLKILFVTAVAGTVRNGENRKTDLG